MQFEFLEKEKNGTIEIPREDMPGISRTYEIWDEIIKLKSSKEMIVSLNDITLEDRRNLVEINKKIEALKQEAKNRLFGMIDVMKGAYSSTNNKDYSPDEIKGIIEKVLAGEVDLKKVPRSPIMGTTENLRDRVSRLMMIFGKDNETIH
jgi:hypothetical protein